MEADDDFVATLDGVLADAVAYEAARARAQERTLRAVAESEATLAGVVVDLVEQRTPIVARTASGRAHRGRLLAAGRDFLVVRDGANPPAILALAALSSIRPQPGARHGDTTGDRVAPWSVSLAALLAELSGDRPRVQVVVTGDDAVTGELRAVGRDVLTIRTDGGGNLVVYARIGAVCEVVLFDL